MYTSSLRTHTKTQHLQAFCPAQGHLINKALSSNSWYCSEWVKYTNTERACHGYTYYNYPPPSIDLWKDRLASKGYPDSKSDDRSQTCLQCPRMSPIALLQNGLCHRCLGHNSWFNYEESSVGLWGANKQAGYATNAICHDILPHWSALAGNISLSLWPRRLIIYSKLAKRIKMKYYYPLLANAQSRDANNSRLTTTYLIK